MGQNITYSCDRCGHVQRSTQNYGPGSSNGSRVMYTVGVVLAPASETNHSYAPGHSGIPSRDIAAQHMWCSSCCNEVLGAGAIVNLDKQMERERREMMQQQQPRFEDHLVELIREVVREETQG